MNIPTLSTTELVLIIALVVVAAACIVAFLSYRKRRTVRLRTQFGDAEYDRAVQKGGDQRHAEAKLEERTQRVEGFHVRPLAAGDRARFVESWHRVQAHFVDGPAGAVTEADQLLGDVMSTRGYPVSNFEQRAADISVDHPLVLETTERLTKSRFGKYGAKPTRKSCARQWSITERFSRNWSASQRCP